MRRLHDGTNMGLFWQIVIFLGGIIPAILSVTGLVMWWRSRGWKKALAKRRGGTGPRRRGAAGCGIGRISVIPAKAGIWWRPAATSRPETPAFAGVTVWVKLSA